MEIEPDLIYIKITISEKDNKNKTPLADREVLMTSKLRDIGIDVNKDLLTMDISSNFKYYLLTKSEIVLSKEYQVVARDGKMTSKVFLALESIGISNVSIEKLDNSNIEKYRKDVKIDAIKAAKGKAEALARAIGQDIGRAIYVQELINNNRGDIASNSIVLRGQRSISGSVSTMSEPEIDFEKIRLEYSIICRFELK